MFFVRELDSKFVFEQNYLILNVIKNAGVNNVGITCDGNRVNKGFFEMFNTIEPWRTTDNIFLLFYYAHLAKHARNIWITESCQEVDPHADTGAGEIDFKVEGGMEHC